MKIHFYLRFATFFFIFFYANQSKAQFSYSSFELNYKWINIEKENNGDFFSENNTRINELTATLNYIYRPIRRLGVGVSISIPVVTVFKWSYNNAPTSGENTYYEDENEFGGNGSQFMPSEYNYDLKNRLGITLIGRFFLSDESTVYADFRYTFSSVNETFTFRRAPSVGLAEQNINFDENHAARGPGFEIGVLGEFGTNFFFNYGFVMDFMKYDVTPFSYNIEYSSDGVVNFRNKLQDSHFSFMIHYGIGYRF